MPTLATLRTEARAAYARGKGNPALKGYSRMSKSALAQKLGHQISTPTRFAHKKTAERLSKLAPGVEEKLGGRAAVLKAIKRAVDKTRAGAKKAGREVTQQELRAAALGAIREQAGRVKGKGASKSKPALGRDREAQSRATRAGAKGAGLEQGGATKKVQQITDSLVRNQVEGSSKSALHAAEVMNRHGFDDNGQALKDVHRSPKFRALVHKEVEKEFGDTRKLSAKAITRAIVNHQIEGSSRSADAVVKTNEQHGFDDPGVVKRVFQTPKYHSLVKAAVLSQAQTTTDHHPEYSTPPTSKRQSSARDGAKPSKPDSAVAGKAPTATLRSPSPKPSKPDSKTGSEGESSRNSDTAPPSKSIKLQPHELEDLTLHAWNDLNEGHNYDGLVPIHHLRDTLAGAVSGKDFDEHLLNMQGNDIFNLQGDSSHHSNLGPEQKAKGIETSYAGRKDYASLDENNGFTKDKLAQRLKGKEEKLEKTLSAIRPTEEMRGTKEELGKAYELRSGKPIKTQPEFEHHINQAYDSLNSEFKHHDLVPVYKLRRALGNRIGRVDFNKHLQEMQAGGKIQMMGTLDEGPPDPKKIRDSITLPMAGRRDYVKRLEQ